MNRVTKILKMHGKDVKILPMDKPINVGGVGNGGQVATHKALVPIIVEGTETMFELPFIRDSFIPALWGLLSLERLRAAIDVGGKALIIPGKGGFSMRLSPGSRVLRLEKAKSGHLMLPVTDWMTHGQSMLTTEWTVYGTEGESPGRQKQPPQRASAM